MKVLLQVVSSNNTKGFSIQCKWSRQFSLFTNNAFDIITTIRQSNSLKRIQNLIKSTRIILCFYLLLHYYMHQCVAQSVQDERNVWILILTKIKEWFKSFEFSQKNCFVFPITNRKNAQNFGINEKNSIKKISKHILQKSLTTSHFLGLDVFYVRRSNSQWETQILMNYIRSVLNCYPMNVILWQVKIRNRSKIKEILHNVGCKKLV